MFSTPFDRLLDYVDPLPGDSSWADFDWSEKVCTGCGSKCDVRGGQLVEYRTCTCTSRDEYHIRDRYYVPVGIAGLVAGGVALFTGGLGPVGAVAIFATVVAFSFCERHIARFIAEVCG
jgi:hypothetical protein